MRLTISERMSILNVLPLQGSIAILRIIQELQKKLSFSEEEFARYKVKNRTEPDGRTFIEWAPEYDKERVDIPISRVESGIIAQALQRLDQNGQLQLGALSIWEYFVEGKEPQA